MTHLGESFVKIGNEPVRFKFGMLFWKLILKHYGKEFHQIGELFRDQLASPVFMLDVLLFGHKAYSVLENKEQVFSDEKLIELANEELTDNDWSNVMQCLLDSKLMGKSLIPADEKKRDEKAA